MWSSAAHGNFVSIVPAVVRGLTAFGKLRGTLLLCRDARRETTRERYIALRNSISKMRLVFGGMAFPAPLG